MEATVIPLRRQRALSNPAALQFLRDAGSCTPDDTVSVASYSELAAMLGWERARTWKAVSRWVKAGRAAIETGPENELISIRVLPDRRDMERGKGSGVTKVKARGQRKRANVVKGVDRPVDNSVVTAAGSGASIVQNSNLGSNTYASTEIADTSTSTVTKRAAETVPDTSTLALTGSTPDTSVPTTPAAAPSMPLPQPENRAVVHGGERVVWRYADGDGGGGGNVIHSRHAPFGIVAAYLTAFALALIAAWFSVRGMVVLFPGDPISARALGIGLETGKIVSVGLLAAAGGRLGWGLRLALVMLALGCEVLNASGVFGQLVIAHLQKGAVAEATFERSDAEASGRIEVAQAKVADLDRRIQTIDNMVDGAAQRGRSRQAADVMRQQQRQRAELVGERDQARRELASLKTSRSSGSAQRKVDAAETAPVVWAARTIGIESDPEVS